MWIRLGYEAPIQFTAQRHGPTIRIHDYIRLVSSSSFQQQNMYFRIGRKPPSHNGAGGACTANYEVVVRLQVSRELLLIEVYSFRELVNIGIRNFHESVLLSTISSSDLGPRFARQRVGDFWPARHPPLAMSPDPAAPPAQAARPGPTRRARERLFRSRISSLRRAEVRLSSQLAGSLAAGNPIVCCE